MSQRLNGCRAKIARANQHITDLKKAVQSHLDLNPLRYRQYYDADTGTLNFVFADGNEIPMSLNIIIGEALYQQRSALDHLIWQLIDHAKAAPTNKSGFPIFTTQKGYNTRSAFMTKGISASAETRVNRQQPFHRISDPKSHPLWMLQELNNTDKHRLLIVTRLFLEGTTDFDIEFAPPGLNVEHGAEFIWMVRTPIEEGALFGRVQTATQQVKMLGKLPAEIALSEIGVAQNEPIIPLLTTLSSYVSETIESFAGEFE